MDQFDGDHPGGVFDPDQGRGVGAQDRAAAACGAVKGGLGLAQGGLGTVPAPPVGRREQVRRVLEVVAQVGDQAEQLRGGGPGQDLSDEQIEQRAEIRAQRQELLTRNDDPLRLWVVLDEAALLREVGGPEVMADQLAHLLEVSRLPRVTIQVTPFSAGAHPGITGPFTILSFPEPEDLPAVHIDSAGGQLFVEEPEEVRRFQIAIQRIQAMALPPADSLRMIATLVKP